MIERTLALARPAGSMEAFVVHPAEGKPFAPVVVYMDMWGVRDALRDVARRLAAAGYYAILPDLYYRRGRVRYAERELPGRRSFADLEPSRQVELRAAMEALSDAMAVDDTRALLAFMAAGEPVRKGAVGAVGYCMGGRHALCVAAAFPELFKATACLHGAGLIRDGEDSPHLVARRALGELYCGHAEKDQYAPPDVAEKLEGALAGSAGRFRQRIHAGLRHGYAVADRDVYDERATALDWEEILGMLQRQLCPR